MHNVKSDAYRPENQGIHFLLPMENFLSTECAGPMKMILPIRDLLTNPAMFLFWFSSVVT